MSSEYRSYWLSEYTGAVTQVRRRKCSMFSLLGVPPTTFETECSGIRFLFIRFGAFFLTAEALRYV